MKKIERALLSVSDKAGIVEFAQALHDLGIELLSTGGTAQALRDAEIPVKDISDFTGFPEMLDGRVKTLHPKVHAGLLYMRGNQTHEATMQDHGLQPIDLVCVNLYPFETTIAKPGVSFEEAIENIDIGGPTMLRSAAKNVDAVTVVTDPADYEQVVHQISKNDGHTTKELRLELALKVFVRLAQYNAAIADYLSRVSASRPVRNTFVVAHGDGQRLRYGENPHQSAVFYRDPVAAEACIAHTEQLHGKEMSYNNYVDGNAAVEAIRELSGLPAVSIIKHTNPCGYATGATLEEAFEAAWASDPVSAFGSVIAVTMPVDIDTAKMLKGRFVEALIAPDFEPDALEFLQNKSKDLRLLKLHKALSAPTDATMFQQINGGLLVQARDVGTFTHWSIPTSELFPEAKRPLAEFGIKACKHVKSNAIILVWEYRPGSYSVLGMGAGQPNRVDSVRKLAVTKARENIALMFESGESGDKSLEELEREIFSECILISDAFFPFPDNIHNAAEAGIRYIVEPGGSKRDEEVISACDQHGIAMVFTGMRHFKH